MAVIASEDWDQYFAERGDVATARGSLREQLDDLSDYVFSSTTSDFAVIDVTQETTKQTIVTNAHEFDDAVRRSPKPRTRIISIHSPRTIAPLKITSSLAAKVFQTYEVKENFLRVLLSFGDEPHQSEAGSSNRTFVSSPDGNYVLSYKLNYVERNHRPGQDPWSFRHVGVYHHHKDDQDLIILLHCSPTSSLYVKLAQHVKHDSENPSATRRLVEFCHRPELLHRLTLACYVDNWRPYLRYLGDQFSKINNRAMVSTAEHTGKENFVHVQKLRNIIDFALFANACCSSNLDVAQSLETSLHVGEKETPTFSTTESMLQGFISSSHVLQDRVRNTIDLIGYTLTLHNQLETARFDREIRDMTHELKNLAQETSVVTKKLKDLTENTVDDSAIVRIITIVSAFYLPGSFVATIFGMNFFDFDAAASRITITEDFWIFVAFWATLTLLTGALFYLTYLRNSWRKKSSRSWLSKWSKKV
ncbi:uncharacterized protein BCR38DRAFT_488219 [Pseudomassariella vexata]|uniref:CorA-like transporter domain-containing protein n=1 Tax=Pseudomassariella vexata TaxID=1141098 RepID=A0A1Y2DLL2_9PEZI|nr:uncharacterized protein BCR38DRAFT_488219 [Pseudomassariella vexata]ORY60026.1 hypothetical protein BCR38DRAFT_488219 [Pseudomassariella vexata]